MKRARKHVRAICVAAASFPRASMASASAACISPSLARA